MPVEAPPAPATVAPKPTPEAPKPAPSASAAPVKLSTPRERSIERMNKSAVKADLAAPHPMSTVVPSEPEKPAPAPDAPRPGAIDAPAEHDDLDPDAPPAPVGDKAPDKPADEPPMSEADKALAAQLSGKDGKKISPWKLVKDFKERYGAAEKEILDLKTRLTAAADAEKAAERAKSIEKRNAELEEEIRYVNYAKSQEFADQFLKPYEEAWAAAASELAELDVLAEDGSPARKATPQDLLALANMPLGEARKQATAMFGDSAEDVMAHRRKVQELSRAQTKALDDARKAGAERTEKAIAAQQSAIKEVTDMFQKLNTEIAARNDFLKPKEGDEEWNSKLTAAQKLADEAFSENATDPSLTPEQRAVVVKKHVAMRNRAIAYSPLKLEVSRLRSQLAAAQKELAQFKDSGAIIGDAQNGDRTPVTPANPMDAAKQRLAKAGVPMPGRYL